MGSRRTPRKVGTVINWGCSEIPGIMPGSNIINFPTAVELAVDKLATFRVLQRAGMPVLEFTEDSSVAKKWHLAGKTVYGRELTRASAGRGIHLFLGDEQQKEIPRLPLYTKFWKCDREQRVHVFRDKIIDFSEKRRIKVDNPPKNRFWVRTHANGWIYAREDAQLHDKVKDACILAVRAVGLDFGAVDVRVLDNGDCRILEINSAPGLAGTTLVNYHQTFWRVVNGR